MKQLVDSPHILLSWFVVLVQPDGLAIVALGTVVIFEHLKKHTAEIEDLRGVRSDFQRLDDMLPGADELPEIDQPLSSLNMNIKSLW